MPVPSGRRVIVAGAGATGSAIAFGLARRGARVIWVDPTLGSGAEAGNASPTNASGVAAGMLAPAFETALDGGSREDFAMLAAARDLWPALISAIGGEVGLWQGGALWLDLPDTGGPTSAGLASRFEAIGAKGDAIAASTARDFLPSLPADLTGALYTPEDWSLDPLLALEALREAALTAGAEVLAARVVGFESGRARLSDGREIPADAVVLATGVEASVLAPELACLVPIKGHILHQALPNRRAEGPVLRGAGGYVSATSTGVHVGATMELGLSDSKVDPAIAEGLRVMGTRLYPALASAELIARTGVRATTPDGLPLVGPSVTPGLFIAAGMRRNGWLLAPLVADMIAAYLTGDDPGPYAARLNPRRFEAS